MRPEIKLEAITRHAIRLLSLKTMTGSKDECENKLKRCIRKLQIAVLMKDKYVVCVSGLQGVGKSLMMQNFYELEEGILPVDPARGEKLPIIISEGDVKQCECYLIKTFSETDEGEDGFIRIKTDRSSFEREAREGRDDIAYLELKVPYKHFYSDNFCFLLLPGFEYDEEDPYFDELVNYSLICSNTVVFGMAESQMSKEDNNQKMKEILMEFDEAKPIFAITHADQETSRQKNEALKNKLMEDYGIPPAEGDRVVLTGDFQEAAENQKWVDALKAALDKYRKLKKGHRRRQLEQMDYLVRTELRDIVEEIEQGIVDYEYKSDVEEARVEDHLAIVDEQIRKLRAKYEKNIHKELNEASKDVLKQVHEHVIHPDGKRKIKEFARSLFKTNSLKDEERLMEVIRDCFLDKSDSVFENRYESAHSNAIMGCVSRTLSIECVSDDGSSLYRIEADGLELQEYREDSKTLVLTEQYSKDIYNIMKATGEEITQKDMGKIMKLIPVIAAQQLAMAYSGEYYLLNKDGYSDSGMQVYDVGTNKYIRSFGEALYNQVTILKGLATVAGVDMVDGEANIMQAIASAVGWEIKGSTAMLLTGGIAGGVAAIAIAKDAVHIYHQNQRNDMKIASATLRELRDNAENNYLELFDDYMDSLRERIRNSLLKMYKVKIADSNIDNLIICKNNVLRDIEEFSEGLNEYRVQIMA